MEEGDKKRDTGREGQEGRVRRAAGSGFGEVSVILVFGGWLENLLDYNRFGLELCNGSQTHPRRDIIKGMFVSLRNKQAPTAG
ncbi:hypothetical protein JZ751_000149 [Albula glossodonta]|uniref:Uncharacterized protein n=1 Tax=Albula glossodonta TaxID=121402 RepID=A0A8T2PVF9_9TELE|nr:hypothetical protein JZ751_000149 [Albula glossodonta]